LGLILDRVKSLFFDLSIKTYEFISQVRSLIVSGQIEEAVTFSDANRKAPVAHIVKAIVERADRDEESIRKGMEISFSEILPKVTQRLGYLAMISNVVTLIGLLGTITGLILAFEAVANADPAKKGEMLAQGISLAMNTTALGLTVAIPVMMIYSVLHAKQNKILNECVEQSSKIMDLLSGRVYVESGKAKEDRAA
jgi:biopolymer transport protein ExbB/TolQ